MQRYSFFNTLLLMTFLINSAQALETIKIVSASPLSGEQAAFGILLENGAKVAVKEAADRFKALGFELELVAQDDQGNPDIGVAIAKRIANDPQVLGVVGHFNSGVTLPASEVYKDYQLAMITPASTNPRITERGYNNITRLCGRDDVQGPAGANFAIDTLHSKKIFIVQDKTTYGQGVAEAFRQSVTQQGATVLEMIGTEEKSDFTSVLQQVFALKPDLIYFGGVYGQGGPLLKQIRENGIQTNFMGPDGLDGSVFLNLAGAASVKNTYYTTVAGPLDTYPASEKFAKQYENTFHSAPESFALYAYDATHVLLSAIENSIAQHPGKIPTRMEVVNAMQKTKMSGVTGDIEFNSKGDRAQAEYFVISLNDGKYPGKVEKVEILAPPK